MKPLTNDLDIQKCTKLAGNKFDLILMAAVRAREISKSNRDYIVGKHKYTVSALDDIQQGRVGRELLRKVAKRPK